MRQIYHNKILYHIVYMQMLSGVKVCEMGWGVNYTDLWQPFDRKGVLNVICL